MRGSFVLLVLALFVLVRPSASVRAEEDPAEIRRLLDVVRREKDPIVWRDAVRRLETASSETRETLHVLLERQLTASRRGLDRARGKIDALIAKVGDGRRRAKTRMAWEEARAHAVEWIFDAEKFPVPEHALITGPCEGYGQARERGDRAIQRWQALERLAARATRPFSSLDVEDAHAIREGWAEAASEHARLRQVLPEARRGDDPPGPDPFALLLLDLRGGDWSRAAEAFASEPPGWRRVILFHAYADAVLDYNEAHPYDMRQDALAGLRIINEYRLALGITPLRHDPRLARAAFGHSDEMTRRGYFSHRSPVPERATKELRAKLEGYDGRVVECITGVGGGGGAVEFWKYDGGHHRDMVEPRWVDGGFSTRGPAVFVGGMGDADSVPVLQY